MRKATRNKILKTNLDYVSSISVFSSNSIYDKGDILFYGIYSQILSKVNNGGVLLLNPNVSPLEDSFKRKYKLDTNIEKYLSQGSDEDINNALLDLVNEEIILCFGKNYVWENQLIHDLSKRNLMETFKENLSKNNLEILDIIMLYKEVRGEGRYRCSLEEIVEYCNKNSSDEEYIEFLIEYNVELRIYRDSKVIFNCYKVLRNLLIEKERKRIKEKKERQQKSKPIVSVSKPNENEPFQVTIDIESSSINIITKEDIDILYELALSKGSDKEKVNKAIEMSFNKKIFNLNKQEYKKVYNIYLNK